MWEFCKADSEDQFYQMLFRKVEVDMMFRIIMGALYFGVFVIGVIGNTSVVYVLSTCSHMRSVTNVFIANLAVADLLVITLCLPFQFISTLSQIWTLGDVLCKLLPYMQGVSVNASIHTLVAISVERCISVCRMKTRSGSNLISTLVIGFIWVYAFVFTIPWLLVFTTEIVEHNNQTVEVCTENWPSTFLDNLYFLCINLGMGYFIPVIIIAICYILIWRTVKNRKIPGNVTAEHFELLRNSRIKVIKMMLFVILLFLILWAPVYIIFILIKFEFCAPGPIWPLVPYAQFCGLFNSCVNPVLYAFCSHQFRRGFFSLAPMKFCFKRLDYDMLATDRFGNRRIKPRNRMTIAAVHNVEEVKKPKTFIRAISVEADFAKPQRSNPMWK